MPDPRQEIESLHAEYQRLTGFPVTLTGREHVWWEWLKRGLSLDDLRAIVADKKKRIRAGELKPVSLAFRNLAGNADFAEEDAALLRAQRRAPRPDPARAEALRASGRPSAPPSQPARSASAIAAKLTSDPQAAAQALADLRRLKSSL